MNDILIHLWFAFLLITFGGCVEGIRRLSRRERIARGERN
jgi:hypothetical protein